MNCLLVIFKPGIPFYSINDIQPILQRAMPQYTLNNSGDSLDLSPWAADIIEPYFQSESGQKIFLQISFYIRDSWLYCHDEYVNLKNLVTDICSVLETDEWWWSSEMQYDQYDEYTPMQIETFLNNKEHTLEFRETLNIESYDNIWFLHDSSI